MTIFEQIKQQDDKHQEYRKARDLGKALGYADFRNFQSIIAKAKDACKGSGYLVSDHFVDVTDMIEVAKGAKREMSDCHMSRYACYLIVQNADPSKKIVALGQTYFATQTRKQELHEEYLEDTKRIGLRSEMTIRNKLLASTAKTVGVTNYATFNDAGYMGLYGGMREKDIHKKKKPQPQEKILDHMGSEELGANIFRATQTDAKIKRENIVGQTKATKTHYEVGKEVRQTIKKLGGTMPEKLPVKENIKVTKKKLVNKGTRKQ